MVRGCLSVLGLTSIVSSTHPAGVGGMLSKLVPKTGGGRALPPLTGPCEFRDDDESERPFTLCDLVAGGGPGGGGGRGIPGSQLVPGGDRAPD